VEDQARKSLLLNFSKLSVTANLVFSGTPPNHAREIFGADGIPERRVYLDQRAVAQSPQNNLLKKLSALLLKS
jgi:hypothetical protein